MTKSLQPLLAVLLTAYGPSLMGQQPDFVANIGKTAERPSMALPDLRGSGDSAKVMDSLNSTLWEELDGSGVLRIVPKVVYPLQIPQQPADFKQPSHPNGLAMIDWSKPPVDADYLTFGYATLQGERLVLFGWLYNVRQPTLATAQLIAKTYLGSLDSAGAKKVAREFASDILRQFGIPSLLGTKIFFVSDRTGPRSLPDGTHASVKEIWSMDYDGTEQRQLTRNNSLSLTPAVSPSGDMLAFTSYSVDSRGHDVHPQIAVFSSSTGRRLTFINPLSSLIATPEFAPDGKHLFFAASFEAGGGQLCVSSVQGADFQRITRNQAIETSPKINPRNDHEMIFISSRSGREQLWRSNIDGSGAEMLTDGRQYVANPSWSPDGRFVAYAATGGYEPGSYSIFIMDIAKRQPIQLTHGDRSESPSWAPDGLHLVFSGKRGGSTQIYTMLADGTYLRQLTTASNNEEPVWAHGFE